LQIEFWLFREIQQPSFMLAWWKTRCFRGAIHSNTLSCYPAANILVVGLGESGAPQDQYLVHRRDRFSSLSHQIALHIADRINVSIHPREIEF
jgi:hypothetical protein